MEPDHTAGIDSVATPPKTTVAMAHANTKVFVCLPWQKHCNPLTAFCLAGLLDRRRTTTCMNFGDAFVAHSRNTCVDLFLASSCEWSFWMDDDMLIPFGNAKWFNAYAGYPLNEKFSGLHAIDRLLAANTLAGTDSVIQCMARVRTGPRQNMPGRLPSISSSPLAGLRQGA